MIDPKKIDWKLAATIISIILGILGFFAGSIWRRADVVFDERAVEIPLSDSLRKSIERALSSAPSDSVAVASNGKEASSSPRLPSTKLPDKLLYVNVRNVGHVPSARIKVRVIVPGEIADKDIADAGSAFGATSQLVESDSTGELSFECQNLANHPQSRVKVAVWYQQTKLGVPLVEIQDTSEGPARQVGSVDDARFYLWEWARGQTGLWSILAALTGALFSYLFGHRLRQPTLAVIYDPLQCGWKEGTRDQKKVMQVFANASIATNEERPIEIVQAYLKGGKSVANLDIFLVAKESAVSVGFSFVVEPVLVKAGEPYKGHIILVDKYNIKYESDELSIPYRE